LFASGLLLHGVNPALTPASIMAWVAVGLVIKTNTKMRRIFKAVIRSSRENELAVYKASAHPACRQGAAGSKNLENE